MYGKTIDERNELAKKYFEYIEDQRKIEDLRSKESDRMQRADLLRFQINEIDKANLSLNEEDLLKSEKNKLQYAEKKNEPESLTAIDIKCIIYRKDNIFSIGI